MTNINVELKGPKGPQIKESLIPTAVSGYKRGLAVVYGADEFHATLASSAGARILGILEEDVVSTSQAVSVIKHGEAVAQIGAAVTVDALLAVNASGQLITAVSTNYIVAKALSANPNAGDYITVMVLDGVSKA